MRTAIIDMGTNTFHLLIAEVKENQYKIIWEERTPVRIGVGGINQNMITPEGIDRALKALGRFKNKTDQLGASKTLAFGTSALRNAENRHEVISKIKETTGIEAKIISGDEEAGFIYEGVNLALNFHDEKALIMDIGGGSVEFIIADGKRIFWKQSFEIGAQRLLERFQKHDPILPSEIEQVFSHYKNSLPHLFEAIKIHAPKTLAGSSGTFDTLSDIYCHEEGIKPEQTPERPLTLSAFEKFYPQIISKNRSERMKIVGMVELRVDMIVVACCLVKYIVDNFQFDKIKVSSYSLKEGVLASPLKHPSV